MIGRQLGVVGDRFDDVDGTVRVDRVDGVKLAEAVGARTGQRRKRADRGCEKADGGDDTARNG
ncbi:hypothetical protein D3C83_328920 [compost metagenome]